MPVIGARTVVECLIRLAEVDGDALGIDRAVNLPSISVTTGEMVESLLRFAGDRRLGKVTIEPDPVIERIVGTWPLFTSSERALALGLPHDDSLDEIVRAYIDDYVS
jgi:nucleoside-diphosphate-sugar epimerase